jgi:hypothetical protein
MENSDIEPKKGKRKYEKQEISIREGKFIKAITEVGSETYGLPIPSAEKAGYVTGQLEHTARRLMQNPRVLLAINAAHAKRMQNTPENLARVMSDLEHTHKIALAAKSMPTLTKVAELRGKYLDLWASSAPPDAETAAEIKARMSAEEKKISLLLARCRTEAESRAELDGKCTPETFGRLTEAMQVISN